MARIPCREVMYESGPDGLPRVMGLRMSKAGKEEVIEADAYVAALDVPGAKKLIPQVVLVQQNAAPLICRGATVIVLITCSLPLASECSPSSGGCRQGAAGPHAAFTVFAGIHELRHLSLSGSWQCRCSQCSMAFC